MHRGSHDFNGVEYHNAFIDSWCKYMYVLLYKPLLYISQTVIPYDQTSVALPYGLLAFLPSPSCSGAIHLMGMRSCKSKLTCIWYYVMYDISGLGMILTAPKNICLVSIGTKIIGQ